MSFQHKNDEDIEGCLKEIPLDIIYYDIISLYESINISFNQISFVSNISKDIFGFLNTELTFTDT